ncbi:MAG TPA: hypothetical protein VKO18_14670 [Terriglobia bacterium]|nr:hypothetical protein [Terriglobia bacterium]
MCRRLILAVLLVPIFAISLPLGTIGGPQAGSDTADQAAIQEAASWIGHEDKVETEYHYVMTCKLRLLLFWAGSDDVGGGYVRIGKASGDEQQQMIQVLFGSDPAKAPLAINRWGAGTEVLRGADSGQPVASAFFGFMKSSKGQSVLAMKSELSKEKTNGNHLFEGIISRVDDGRALSTTVPYSSNRDFDVHQYAEAEKATLQQLESNPSRHIRSLDGAARKACPRAGEFLSTTFQLIDDAVAGHTTPDSLCYIYNAHHYKATLLSVHPVEEKKVHVTLRGKGKAFDQTYRHLREAHFEVANDDTGTKSSFDILLGTEGNLRGTPVQILYTPNWWFEIILNLAPASPQPLNPGTSLR